MHILRSGRRSDCRVNSPSWWKPSDEPWQSDAGVHSVICFCSGTWYLRSVFFIFFLSYLSYFILFISFFYFFNVCPLFFFCLFCFVFFIISLCVQDIFTMQPSVVHLLSRDLGDLIPYPSVSLGAGRLWLLVCLFFAFWTFVQTNWRAVCSSWRCKHNQSFSETFNNTVGWAIWDQYLLRLNNTANNYTAEVGSACAICRCVSVLI